MSKRTKLQEKQKNGLLAALYVVILFLWLGNSFDFYYDLNDDVLLKDIFSGAYAGTPDAHSIQVIYLLGLLFSCLYRIVPAVPWFGVFLLAGMGISLWVIFSRMLSLCKSIRVKIALLVAGGMILITVLLRELVYVQYTVVSGMLLVAGVVIFLTTPRELPVREFLKENIGTILLAILAFYLRPMMIFCMAPFIGAAGIFHWSQETTLFSKENLQKYLGIILAVLIGMGIGLISERIGYRSQEWRDFSEFYDAREQVYDYTWYPVYEYQGAFYESIGVSEPQYRLVRYYNFGLDEEIDTTVLQQIAEFGEKQKSEPSLVGKLKEAVSEQAKRLFTDMDAPYNRMIIIGYALLIVLGVFVGDKSLFWKVPLLVACRSVSWMYIIMAKRVVERVSHPLYVMEIVFLIIWAMKLIYDNRENQFLRGLNFGLVLGTFLFIEGVRLFHSAYVGVEWEQYERLKIGEPHTVLNEYAREHPENYYLVDVYSFHNYSEKIFTDGGEGQKNYDTLGGWFTRSPLNRQALSNYGTYETDSLYRILLEDNFYFVIQQSGEYQYILDLYEEKGYTVQAKEIAQLGSGENVLVVYQFVE